MNQWPQYIDTLSCAGAIIKSACRYDDLEFIRYVLKEMQTIRLTITDSHGVSPLHENVLIASFPIGRNNTLEYNQYQNVTKSYRVLTYLTRDARIADILRLARVAVSTVDSSIHVSTILHALTVGAIITNNAKATNAVCFAMRAPNSYLMRVPYYHWYFGQVNDDVCAVARTYGVEVVHTCESSFARTIFPLVADGARDTLSATSVIAQAVQTYNKELFWRRVIWLLEHDRADIVDVIAQMVPEYEIQRTYQDDLTNTMRMSMHFGSFARVLRYVATLGFAQPESSEVHPTWIARELLRPIGTYVTVPTSTIRATMPKHDDICAFLVAIADTHYGRINVTYRELVGECDEARALVANYELTGQEKVSPRYVISARDTFLELCQFAREYKIISPTLARSCVTAHMSQMDARAIMRSKALSRAPAVCAHDKFIVGVLIGNGNEVRASKYKIDLRDPYGAYLTRFVIAMSANTEIDSRIFMNLRDIHEWIHYAQEWERDMTTKVLHNVPTNTLLSITPIIARYENLASIVQEIVRSRAHARD
jgi:hypothetical protein